MRIKPPLKPPRLKDIPNWVKKPGNIQRLIGRLFPLGQGGLRYPPPKSPHDFLNDISVPYDYQTHYPGFQAPIFGEAVGEPDVDLGARPQEGTGPRSRSRRKDKEKTGEPVPQPTFPLEDVPRPDDLIEDVPPTHPIEQSDEATDEGEPKEPRRPRRRPPEYDAYNCQTIELLTGIPCNQFTYEGFQISTQKASKLRQSPTSRSGRLRTYNKRPSQRSQVLHTRHNVSRLRQPSSLRPSRWSRSSSTRSRSNRRYNRWY